jgi:hypothetical protein
MSALCSAPIAAMKPGSVGNHLVAGLVLNTKIQHVTAFTRPEKPLIFKEKLMSGRGMQIASVIMWKGV